MTEKFCMFLNYIGPFYIWKIVSYIDLFAGHFKYFNTLIFSVPHDFYYLILQKLLTDCQLNIKKWDIKYRKHEFLSAPDPP